MLRFDEYPILESPFVRTPDGSDLMWKKEIDVSFGKYKAKGFIAILREMNSKQNGIVLMRRGRVIIGAEEEKRYFPKSLMGSVGTFRYKRLFGELNLEGFSVSFNKDGVKETEDLDALMQVLRGEIHTKDFDLFTQADEYRPDNTRKKVKSVIIAHTNVRNKKGTKPTAVTKQIEQPTGISQTRNEQPDLPKQQKSEIKIGDWTETFTLDGTDYQMKLLFVDEGHELLWLNIHNLDKNIFECKINAKHPFFNTFSHDKIDKSAIAILRAMAMAKFSANMKEGTASEVFDYFNDYIRNIKP